MKKYFISGVLYLLSFIVILFLVQKETNTEHLKTASNIKTYPPKLEVVTPVGKPQNRINVDNIKDKTLKQIEQNYDPITAIKKRRDDRAVRKDSAYFTNIFKEEAIDQEWAIPH